MPINETVGSEGKYAVPVEYVKELWGLAGYKSVALNVFRTVAAKSNAGNLVDILGMPTAEFVDEGNTATESVPTFGNPQYSLKKLQVHIQLTDEWREDTFLTEKDILATMTEAFAGALDDAVFNADGTAGYKGMKGLANLTSADGVNEIDLGATALDYDSMSSALKTYRTNLGGSEAAWVFSPNGLHALRTMTNPSGQYIFDEKGLAEGGLVGSVFGIPVYEVPALTSFEQTNGGVGFLVDKRQAAAIVTRYDAARFYRERVNLADKESLRLTQRLDFVPIVTSRIVKLKNFTI